jgi:hypothetical protein
MGNFIIDLFKKSQKNDSFRPAAKDDKYNDNVAALNATNQSKPTTSKLSKALATMPDASGNSTVPGK